MLVVGVKNINYISKKTNEQVRGVELHYQYEDKSIDGFGCFHEYISQNVIEKSGGYIPKIGDNIEIYYSVFGNKKYPSFICKIDT